MKKLNLIQISNLVFASSLSLLAACQTLSLQPNSHIQPIQQIKSGLQSIKSPDELPLAAAGWVFTDSNGQQRLRLSLMSNSADFKTKALECGQIESVLLTISGFGIETPLIINANYSPSNCMLTSDPLPDIPVGNARILSLQALDSSSNLVAELKTLVRISPGQAADFELSQKTSIAADLLQAVIAEGSPRAIMQVSRLDLVAYQKWFDDLLLGVTGTFPNYTYLNHPKLVDVSALLNAILNINNGKMPTTVPSFLLPSATVTITVNGVTPNEPLKVWLNDLATPLKVDNNPASSSRTFIFAKVPPGSLTAKASNDGKNTDLAIVVSAAGSNNYTLDLTGGAVPVAAWDDLSGGPAGGRMLSLVKDTSNSDVFTVAENGHVFRSNDSGANWSDVSANALDLKPVTALATDNAETVYAGTSLGRVYKRKFGAAPDSDWVLVGSGAINGGVAYITKLYVDPENANRIYAGTLSDGIHEWGGSSWSAVNSGLGAPPFAPVKDILKDPVNDHFYMTLFKSNGLYKTTIADAPGSGWAAEATGLNATHFPYSLALSGIGNKVLLGTSLGGFYTSPRASTSWTLTNGGLPTLTTVKGIVQVGDTSKTIYAVTESSLHKGVDTDLDGIPDTSPGPAFINTQVGGDPFPPANPASPRLNNIVATSTTAVLVGTMGAGIQRRNNASPAWSSQNSGIHNAFVQDLLKIPANGSALYAATHSGVMRSTDSGTSWQAMLNVASTGQERIVTSLAFVPGASNNDIYMGTDGDGVFLLNDVTDGSSETTPWVMPFVQPANQNIKDMMVLTNGAVLAATTTGTFGICSLQIAGCSPATSYGTTTWTNTGAARDAFSLALKPGTVDYVYSGGVNNYHYNADLTGSGSWTSVPFPASGSGTAVALATSSAVPNVLYIGVKGASAGDAKVYKTVDSGGSTTATGDFPIAVKDVYALYVDQSDADLVYAGTNNGVYVSTDGGATWSAFSSGSSALTGIPVSSLTLIGSDLYAGTAGRSIFVTSLL